MHENKKNLTSPPVDKSRHLDMNYETPRKYKYKIFFRFSKKTLAYMKSCRSYKRKIHLIL